MNTFLQRYWKALVLMLGLMFLAWYTLSYTTIFRTSVLDTGQSLTMQISIDGEPTTLVENVEQTFTYSNFANVIFSVIPSNPSDAGTFNVTVTPPVIPFESPTWQAALTAPYDGVLNIVVNSITSTGPGLNFPVELKYIDPNVVIQTGTGVVTDGGDGGTSMDDDSQPPSEPSCGDGNLDAGEACDPPDGVACDTNCQPISTTAEPICGDGIIQAPEQCERPNTPGCGADCQPFDIVSNFCGDGIVQTPNDAGQNEECEPVLDPACSADCKLPVAGGELGQDVPPVADADSCTEQIWREEGPAVYEVNANSPASYPYIEYFYDIEPSHVSAAGVEIRGYEGLVWIDHPSGQGVLVYVPLLEKVELGFWLDGTLHCLTTYKLDHRDTDGDKGNSIADYKFITRALVDALKDVAVMLSASVQEFVAFLARQ